MTVSKVTLGLALGLVLILTCGVARPAMAGPVTWADPSPLTTPVIPTGEALPDDHLLEVEGEWWRLIIPVIVGGGTFLYSYFLTDANALEAAKHAVFAAVLACLPGAYSP